METQRLLTMKPATNYLPFSALVHRFLANISFVVLLAFSLYSHSLYANVTSVIATPGIVSVPVTGSTTVNITWQVSRFESTTGAVTVSSPTASLTVQGITIAVGTALSQTSNIPTGTATTLRFNETLTLSAALTRRIAESPAGSVLISRVFDDQQTNSKASVRVAAGQNSSAPLTVRRIDLSFDTKARTDVIHQGESLRAIVDISFRSSGVLRGEWRLIDPSASLGQSGGRVLQVVRKNLVSSGEGRTRIISPPLPSQQTGLYLLAFAVQQESSAIDTPILRYFVLDKQRNTLSEVASIKTLSPAGRTTLSDSTLFSWQAVKQAHAYQVAIFNKGDTVPISGKLITGQYAALTLSDFSRESLLPGYEYSWQVRAFDQQGNLVASSPISTLYLPE